MMPDTPIPNKANDLLHRYPLASRIAEMISSFKDPDSLVIGIEGEWGSGKTSFMNLILEDLRKTDALLITFNPWNFSDQNELMKDFFDSISDALNNKVGNKGAQVARNIKEYGSKLIKNHITISPEISIGGVATAKLGEIKKGSNEEPLEKRKDKINKSLKKLGKRIVIVIDDIDRLDSHETKLIFKLVKMTANFEKTIFLLAYDRGKVGQRINENGIKGEDYLKKIIQVSFTLPKPDPQDLFKILTSDIDRSIQEFDKKFWSDKRWGNLYLSGFKNLFPTIRDIKRYISGLQLDLAIIGKEEVNPIDFLGIEALRVFAPEVYMAIADEKRTFTATASTYFDDSRRTEERKHIFEQILNKKSPSGLTQTMREIVLFLFPQMAGLYTNYHYSHHSQLEWRKQLQVCSEDIFDKYFSLTITSSTVSEKSLKDVLAAIDDQVAFTQSLQTVQAKNKLRLVLERLFDHIDELKEEQREQFLIGLFDFCENVNDPKQSMLDLQAVDEQTWRLGYQVLKGVSKEHRIAFLTNVLHRTKSVFVPLQLMNALDHMAEEQEEKETSDEALLTKKELSGLLKICVDKLHTAAEDSTLVTNKHVIFLLQAWKAWESEKAVKAYVAELIKTTPGLLALLRGFEWEAISETAGDHVATKTRKMNKNSLAMFIDINKINKKIQALKKEELSQEDQETIALFNAPPDTFDELFLQG